MPFSQYAKLLPVMLLVLFPLAGVADEAATPRPAYGVMYTVWLKPATSETTVRIRLSRHPEWVRWMRFNADPARFDKFKASGELKIEGHSVLWRPPATDAWLQYRTQLESRRDSGRFDGLVGKDWAMFRADNLVPPVHLDMQDGTQSQAKLRINLPEGWSLETPFPRYPSGRLRIDNPRRLFDRPTGWILAGKIGTRRETIGKTNLTVAAPIGEGVRRMDMLAFFRWTVPTLQAMIPAFPTRLLVVSAGDPMWRGALSAPNSLFVHADRPMISENSTSTLLHELIHVAMRAQSIPGADWIVEGLAEYYSLETLHRSGAISDARYEKAHAVLATWGAGSAPLDSPRSFGAITARAVGVLRSVDREIRKSSGGTHSLDDVLRALAADPHPVTLSRFKELAATAAGRPVRSIPL